MRQFPFSMKPFTTTNGNPIKPKNISSTSSTSISKQHSNLPLVPVLFFPHIFRLLDYATVSVSSKCSKIYLLNLDLTKSRNQQHSMSLPLLSKFIISHLNGENKATTFEKKFQRLFSDIFQKNIGFHSFITQISGKDEKFQDAYQVSFWERFKGTSIFIIYLSISCCKCREELKDWRSNCERVGHIAAERWGTIRKPDFRKPWNTIVKSRENFPTQKSHQTVKSHAPKPLFVFENKREATVMMNLLFQED